MTKKTRVRVARIAAGAVIAAGASLTAAGAASAVGIGINVGPLEAKANANEKGIDVGLGINEDPTGEPTPTEDPTVIAETGAAETTFLLIGAATMIAGGIGFRMLPRLVSGGRTAA